MNSTHRAKTGPEACIFVRATHMSCRSLFGPGYRMTSSELAVDAMTTCSGQAEILTLCQSPILAFLMSRCWISACFAFAFSLDE